MLRTAGRGSSKPRGCWEMESSWERDLKPEVGSEYLGVLYDGVYVPGYAGKWRACLWNLVLGAEVFRDELCSGRQYLLRDGVQCMLGNVVLGVVFGAQGILGMVFEVTGMRQRCGSFCQRMLGSVVVFLSWACWEV